MKGSYTLLLNLSEQIDVEVGSLGSISFSPGFYAYNGSAFGPGGLKRVERHKEKLEGNSSCHWHIDYLLTLECSEIVEIFKKVESDHECSLSHKMTTNFKPIKSFGCSDCDCSSHLYYSSHQKTLQSFLKSFYS